MLRDGIRLLRHVGLADRLELVGLRADAPLRIAGYDFWVQPWYRRWNRRYLAV